MGTIEKRGKNSWRVGVQVFTMEHGWQWVRHTIRMDPGLSQRQQRQKAEEALEKLIEDVGAERERPGVMGHTVRTWSEVWMEQHVKPNCSPVTYGNYRFLLDSRILPLLGDVPLVQLTPMRLTQWLNEVRDAPRLSTRKEDEELARPRAPSQKLASDKKQAKALSNKTVLHYYACMEAMLSVAVRLEYLERNPMEKVTRPKVRKARVQSLSEERAVELLRCLADEPNMCYRAAVLLALLCGLRLGEVGELKISDVDFNDWTIDISRALKYSPRAGNYVAEPKTESSERIISLPMGMMVVLEETKKYQEECQQLVPHLWQGEGWIVHGWDGRQLHHDTPSKWFRKFADSHGFQGVRFHDLRHTHASILLANNLDVVAVAGRMGHGDPTTTLRVYAHALARRDREAAKTLDRLFGDIPMPARPDLTPRPHAKAPDAAQDDEAPVK